MKKLICLLCLALFLTGCSDDNQTLDYMDYADSESTSESVTEQEDKEVNIVTKVEQEITTEVSEKPVQKLITDEELEKLDNKEIGFGQGKQVNSQNQPIGAIDFNNKYGEYNAQAIVQDGQKNIYLTFDQGYENGYTPKILDTLKEKDVKAVFFLTGGYVRSQPELIQRMIDEGHVLGNHGDMHKSLPLCTIQEAEKELQDCHDLVKEKFDYDLKLQRPPCGTYSEKSLALSQRLGYTSCLWSFAYVDWKVDDQPNEEEAYKKIVSSAHDGGIYLLHSVSKTNANILGRVIDELKSQGYNLTTLKEN